MQLIVVIIVLALIVLIAYLFKQVFELVTVWDYEKGLKYSNGRFVGLIQPGLYFTIKPFTQVLKVDCRAQDVVIAGQEVLTSDAIAIKVSITAKYQVSDPRVAIQESANYFQSLYIVLQTVLREIIAQQTADELLENRGGFDDRLLELAKPQAAKLGIELLSAKIRDITFPGDLKKAFAQVVMARKEGQAALERARGEGAALRSLANTARMIENNPALMHLRTIQAISESPGSTIVMGLPENSLTFPKTSGSENKSSDEP